MNHVVRAVTDADFPAIADLTNFFIKNTPVHVSYEPVTVQSLADSWRRFEASYPFLVLEVDGQFAGYAKAGQWRERAAYHWSAETGIYLTNAARGRGLGRELYVELLDAMTERGLHQAIASITIPNEASFRLHESLGFESSGVVRRAAWKFGQWHDVAFLQKLLRGADHAPSPPPKLT